MMGPGVLHVSPILFGQWLHKACTFHGEWQESKENKSTMQAHFKPLLALCSLTSLGQSMTHGHPQVKA